MRPYFFQDKGTDEERVIFYHGSIDIVILWIVALQKQVFSEDYTTSTKICLAEREEEVITEDRLRA